MSKFKPSKNFLKNVSDDSSDGDDFELDENPILKPDKTSEKKLKKNIITKLKKPDDNFNQSDTETKTDSDTNSDSDTKSNSDTKKKSFIKKNKIKIEEKDVKNNSGSSSDSDTHTESDSKNKKKVLKKNVKSDSDSDSDSSDSGSKKKISKKKTSKKIKILKTIDDDKKKINKQLFNKEIIYQNDKNEENILIITDKEESNFYKENICFNYSKNIKKNNIHVFYYKTVLEIIYKILEGTFEEENKKKFCQELKQYKKIFLISKNPLTIFLSLYLCKNQLFCIYESLKDLNEIFKQDKPSYEKENIKIEKDEIKENYLNFLHSNKKEKTIEEKINNEISIEIENLYNYYLINYFSGLNYIEEEILFFILNNNLNIISFNNIFSFLNKKINIYYELSLLKSFKNLVKKFNNIFFKTNVLNIKNNTNIEVDIKKLKQVYFIYKNFEQKKKIILVSILPIFYIENTNYLKYDIKDMIEYFKNKFNKTNLKTYYEKKSNIEIDNTEKNVTLKFEIIDSTKVNVANMDPFDKLDLMKKCLKLKEKITIENNIICFSKDIEQKRFHIQKKLFKNNINCFKNKIYTFGILKEKVNEICLFYYENLCKYLFFIILINLYKQNNNSKEVLEKILVFKNNKNYIYVFPFDDPKNIENYVFDYLEEYIKDFSLENFKQKEEEIYIESLLKSKYNSL